MTQNDVLVSTWREIGPLAWSQGPYGWIVEDGQPLTLTPWQAAALGAWWAHKEDCSTLAISNVKKTGKTMLNAVLLAWRWLCLPGQHFAAGNDLDQAAARSFAMVAEMCQRNPYLKANVKANRNELEFTPTGSKLTALAADASGNAGANHLTSSHTEAWGIIYESGIRSWEELTPPPGKTYGLPALRIADSYAGFENESKTWHSLVDRGLTGKRIDKDWPIFQAGGLILFHMEGEEARERCYRGTPQDADIYYQDQAASLRANAFIRMHNNQRTAGESAFIQAEDWEACERPGLQPFTPGAGRRLVVGADASTSRDLTSLVGVEYNETTGISAATYVRLWKPQKSFLRRGKPTVDLDLTIGAAVMELHQSGSLAAVVADNFQLHTLIIAWEKAGIKVIDLAQNAGRVDADQALYDAINSRTLEHYGDPQLTEAVLNAVARETPRGFRLDKEKASKKIDAAVALSMAHWGARLGGGNVSYDVTPVKDPFALWPPAEGDKFSWVFGWGDSWHTHHSPGATSWRDCKYRQKGCEECYQETTRKRPAPRKPSQSGY